MDGDLYNLIPLDDPNLQGFEPRKFHRPANYEPAQKKLLDRPSTMGDVAEFFMEYITSDVSKQALCFTVWFMQLLNAGGRNHRNKLAHNS